MLNSDKLFFVDFAENVSKSYSELLEDLANINSSKFYIYEKNTYKIFLSLLHSIVYDYPVTMLDSDFSEEEIINLDIDISLINKTFTVATEKIDIVEFIKLILSNKTNWSLTLFTSGTTGRPKKIKHNLLNLTKFVKNSEKYSSDIWALAYNPTHFAGLQVFFQAIFNLNTIINVTNCKKNELDSIIDRYQITNISATPTFYRFIFPFLKDEHKSVTKCTMGGEKFDQNIVGSLKDRFPEAKFINIYASTEAGSLFTSDGDYFYIPNSIKKQISISNDNELLIHLSLLGEGDFGMLSEKEWYSTGDIVEPDHDFMKFRIISRNTEMINVGGYKINPHEIEILLKQIVGVTDALVYGRKNSITGNIVAADIVKIANISEDNLRNDINNQFKLKLQEWKIPRIIKFVDNIQIGRTGKKVRK